jgi:surface-adhesin protein E
MKRWILWLLLVFMPAAATAQEKAADRWRLIGEVPRTAKTWFDTQSIVRKEGDRGENWGEVWVRIEYNRVQKDAGRSYNKSLIRWIHDCENRTSAERSWTHYLRDSVVVSGRERPDVLLEWSQWLPDSVGEQMGEAICAYVRAQKTDED